MSKNPEWGRAPHREPSNTPPTQAPTRPRRQLPRVRPGHLADPYPLISLTRWQPTTTITTIPSITISTLTRPHPLPHPSSPPPLRCHLPPRQLYRPALWSSHAAPTETTTPSTPPPTPTRQSTAAQAPHLRTACRSLFLLWASRHIRGRAATAGTLHPSTATWCRDASTALVSISSTSKLKFHKAQYFYVQACTVIRFMLCLRQL